MELPSRPHRYRKIFFSASGALLIFVLLAVSVSMYVKYKVKEAIFSLQGKISSIDVNLMRRSIRVSDLAWSSGPGSVNLNPHSLQLRSVTASGINLYELLFNKTLRVNQVIIDSGVVAYSQNEKQSDHKIKKSAYYLFVFESISLNKIQTRIKTDTVTSFAALLSGNVTDVRIKIDSLNKLTYSVATTDATLEHLIISRKEGLYGGTIRRVVINTRAQKISIDSALLIPNYGKYEFAHQVGEQAARMSLTIPQLTIGGLKFDQLQDSAFSASKIVVKSAELLSFKDKRVPFLRKKNIPLPMEPFLRLPFLINIDSILVQDSRISVEEFPEDGNTTGTVTFEKIEATLLHLNNRIGEPDVKTARLNATALLMGSGSIEASFDFPLDGSPLYTARGSIQQMPFQKLNPVLGPLAHLRVESGHLNKLAFQFKYNEYSSNGSLTIDYVNLQLMSLDRNHRATDGFKTFLMNALVRKDQGRSRSSVMETSVIDIERDRKRYIFHVWLRSILGGLKSNLVRAKTGQKK
jgi:hypothetical protein